MTAPARRKGSRIGPRLRAEAAILEAEGVLSRTGIAQRLRIARESLRQLHVGSESDQFREWCALAKRRLTAGVARARIVEEILETVAVAPEEPDPAAAWDAILGAARYLAGLCRAFNRNHASELLESDPDRLVALAALHVGESEPGPGCSRCVGIGKAVLDASLAVAYLGRDTLIAAQQRGTFIPLRPEEEMP